MRNGGFPTHRNHQCVKTRQKSGRIGVGASCERPIASGLMSNIVSAGLLPLGLSLTKTETIELAAFDQSEAEYERSAGS